MVLEKITDASDIVKRPGERGDRRGGEREEGGNSVFYARSHAAGNAAPVGRSVDRDFRRQK